MHSTAATHASRIGDGCRSSTPGRGERLWTAEPGDTSMFKTGPAWGKDTSIGGYDRNPLPWMEGPRAGQMLSDVAHRAPTTQPVPIVAANHRKHFAGSLENEAVEQERRQAALVARRQAAESRVLHMVHAKSDYIAHNKAEMNQALQAQQEEKLRMEAQAKENERRTAQQQNTREAVQEQLIQSQVAVRRDVAAAVAREQLQQMQDRKARLEAERRADHARARAGDDGTGFQSKFGTSIV